MTFWSTRDFKENFERILPKKQDQRYFQLQEGDKVRIEKRTQGSSIELSLGEEVFISSQRDLKLLKKEDKLVTIAPGDFALLITKEWIKIPSDCMGFIAMKTKHKLSGLINVSGFHVDPGFYGRLKFSVYNAGTANVVLKYGEATFILFVTYVRDGVDPNISGSHWGQEHIEPHEMTPLAGCWNPHSQHRTPLKEY
ncbi:MAG: hypothetical protein JRJ38_01930 [Deltaproteobacteria bacterium]|nr:hypothetical protein [Deltaproteobacteria bacterium]